MPARLSLSGVHSTISAGHHPALRADRQFRKCSLSAKYWPERDADNFPAVDRRGERLYDAVRGVAARSPVSFARLAGKGSSSTAAGSRQSLVALAVRGRACCPGRGRPRKSSGRARWPCTNRLPRLDIVRVDGGHSPRRSRPAACNGSREIARLRSSRAKIRAPELDILRAPADQRLHIVGESSSAFREILECRRRCVCRHESLRARYTARRCPERAR